MSAVTPGGRAQVVALLRELAEDVPLDGKRLHTLGEWLIEACDATARREAGGEDDEHDWTSLCGLVQEIVARVELGLDRQAIVPSSVPASTTLLDPHHGLAESLAKAYALLRSHAESAWPGRRGHADDHEAALRRLQDLASRICEGSGDATKDDREANLYAKTELGRAIASHLVSLGTSRCEGLAVAKQEALETAIELMYGCVANLAEVLGTLNSGGGGLGFLDFLGSCQDYQRQLHFLNMAYRLHKHSSKKANGSSKDCRQFLDQDFGPFGGGYFSGKYKTHQEMNEAGMRLLNAFNAKHSDHIRSFKVRSVAVASDRASCGDPGKSLGTKKQTLVVFGGSLVTLFVTAGAKDCGDLVELPLSKVKGAELVESRRGACRTYNLYVTAAVNPDRLATSLEPGEETVILLTGAKKDMEGIKGACFSSRAHLEPASPVAYERPSQRQKLSIGTLHDTTGWSPSSEREAEAEVEADNPSDLEKTFIPGRALGVYWDGDDCYYYGKVSECNEGEVLIEYDDGEEEWIVPSERKIVFHGDKQQEKSPTPGGTSSLAEEEASEKPESSNKRRKQAHASQSRSMPKPSHVKSRKPEAPAQKKLGTVTKRPVKRKIDLSPQSDREEYLGSGSKESGHPTDSEDLPSDCNADDSWQPSGYAQARPPQRRREIAAKTHKRKPSVAKVAKRKPAASPKVCPPSPPPALRYNERGQADSIEDSMTPEETVMPKCAPSAKRAKSKTPNRSAQKKKACAKLKDSRTKAKRSNLKRKLPTPSPELSTRSESELTPDDSSSPDFTLSDTNSQQDKSSDEDLRDDMKIDDLGLPGRKDPKSRASDIFGDLDSSLLTGSTGSESDMRALSDLIQTIMTARKEKRGRKKQKMEEAFAAKVQGDSKKLEGFIDGAIEESHQFCQDVYAGITKEFDDIDAKVKRCVVEFNEEMQSLSRGYRKFLDSIGQRERDVESFAQMKIKHAKDLTVKARSRAEELMKRTRAKMEELDKKKDSSQQISQLLSALMAEG